MFENSYRKIDERNMPECGGTGTVYEHIKTGAKVFTIKNGDNNKVFCIGFRTTPTDSTGVAHILEHSVLCGSEKFPLKDPFIELAKGSLNTFLNAMTYPDKTIYPVASCNDKDFMNLMDVYLDAVFHPRIYSEKKIFMQEGWHYEIDENGNLIVNGVVYNEMKGAFSNPDQVLERYILNSLYPHTTYGHESGGDPENIPDLTYENFLKFHSTYYHPSNSYIYLYGDMDMEEKLLWIDENYLSGYEKKEMDTRVTAENAPASPVYFEKPYAVAGSDGIEKKNYLSENFVIADGTTSLTSLAWEALESVLLSAPGAPLKEALVKAGIGEDIYGGYSDGIRQPYFSIVAKNAEKSALDKFRTVIRETVEELVKNGLPEKTLRGALNYIEFKYREEDNGRTPTGLDYGITAFDSWLYDGEPYEYLRYEEEFRELRTKVGTGWFEDLLKNTILDNAFRSTVVITPEEGLTEKIDAGFAEKMAALKATLTKAELDEIRNAAEELKAYQEEPDSEEAKTCLPHLSLSDLGTDSEKMHTSVKNGLIHTELPSKGIAYIRLLYDLTGFTGEEVQLVSFLKELYGELDTKEHNYVDLSDEVLLETGGVSFNVDTYMHEGCGKDGSLYSPVLIGEIRVLEGNIEKGISLSGEMFTDTQFTDADRIVEKLLEAKSRQQYTLEAMSHMMAMVRASSYTEGSDRFSDLVMGIAYSDFLSAAAKLVKEPVHKKRFIKSLADVSEKLKTVPVCASICGSEAACEKLAEVLIKKGVRTSLFPVPGVFPAASDKAAAPEKKEAIRPVSALNEGMRTGSQVNYVARAGRYADSVGPENGSAQVLKVLLNYDYLWTNLRVKGGAYGCMSGFTRSGKGWLVSYRDPHVKETNDIYEALPEYLENLEITDGELLQYIIGAISGFDRPSSVSVKAAQELANFLYPITSEDIRKQRDSILTCTVGDLRSWGKKIARMLSAGAICTIGSAGAIEKDRDLFRSIRDLT